MVKACKANPHSDLKLWEIVICLKKECQYLDRTMIDWEEIKNASW